MKHTVLSILCLSLIVISVIPNAFPYTDSFIPPTIAFSKIYSGLNHIQAKNYYGRLNITAGTGISITPSNGTTAPSLTIANTASPIGTTAINFTSSSNKTGTASYNMLGDGVTLTPIITGRASITVSGYAMQDTSSSGGAIQIRQITGGCPSNGNAVTGTALGSNIKTTMISSTFKIPFSITVQTTGLSINQKYCFELSQQSITSGTFTVFNVMWAAQEI